tara:strand:+ start:223 stop:1047 length:825 start_codon:yes stop_codon:yes gene_type:complete
MPKLQNRANAMMSVKQPQPTQKVVEEKPEKPPITEKEAEIFNKEPKIKLDDNRDLETQETQNIDMTITPPTEELHTQEFVEEYVEPVKKKKEKKPCSDKLKAHLQRCREKSLATRRARKEQKSKPIDIPKPAPTQPVVNNNNIDYDRIISGVSNSLYSRFGLDEPDYQPPPQPTQSLRIQQQPQQVNQQRQVHFQQQQVNQQEQQRKMLLDYEKKIREDERKKIKEERERELNKTYKSKGMNVLKNGMPTHRKRDMNIPINNANPFANAFGRRY